MTAIVETNVTAEPKNTVAKAPEGTPDRVWSALDNPESERARAKALFEAQYIRMHDLRKNA